MKENTHKENIKTLEENNMEIEESGWTKIKCKDRNHDDIAKENKWELVTNKGKNKKEKQIEENVEENYYKTLSNKEDVIKIKFQQKMLGK